MQHATLARYHGRVLVNQPQRRCAHCETSFPRRARGIYCSKRCHMLEVKERHKAGLMKTIEARITMRHLKALPVPCKASEAAEGRKLHCAHQSVCNAFVDALQHARGEDGRREWIAESWKCGECSAYRAMDNEERQRDVDALIRLAGDVLCEVRQMHRERIA